MARKSRSVDKHAKRREERRRLKHAANSGLQEAWRRAQAGRWNEAAEMLEDLDRRHPRSPEILRRLVDAYQHLQQFGALQSAAQRLLEIERDSADLTLLVAGCCLSNQRLALALDYFERFVSRWPSDPRAEHVRHTIAALESAVETRAVRSGVARGDGRQLVAEHEAVLAAIAANEFDRAETLAARLWERCPTFAAAGNNLADAIFAQGRFEESLDVVRRVIQRDPTNAYALASLAIRFAILGRWDEARATAERLRAVGDKSPDVWVKQAEVFSYLGDDQSVLEAWREAEKASDAADRVALAFGHHLAAVACLRLDRTEGARRHWEHALELAPDLTLAKENRDDCTKPAGQRQGPWPFEMSRWLGRETLEAFGRDVAERGRGSDQATAEFERGFLQQHPHLEAIIPALLDRGPPPLREFALIVAKTADTPALRQVLLDFAQGKRGSDDQRLSAAEHLARLGALQSRQMRFWVQGQWGDIMLQDYELHGEATSLGEPRADELVLQAHQALRNRDGSGAERLLEQAIDIVPDNPTLHNNLANAYLLQGREREAIKLARWIRERFPDYLFGRVQFAHRYLSGGELERANAELAPLRSRRRLHFTEFSALMHAEVSLCHARGNDDAARQTLKLWKQVLPDDPKLADAREVLEGRRRFGFRQFV